MQRPNNCARSRAPKQQRHVRKPRECTSVRSRKEPSVLVSVHLMRLFGEGCLPSPPFLGVHYCSRNLRVGTVYDVLSADDYGSRGCSRNLLFVPLVFFFLFKGNETSTSLCVRSTHTVARGEQCVPPRGSCVRLAHGTSHCGYSIYV